MWSAPIRYRAPPSSETPSTSRTCVPIPRMRAPHGIEQMTQVLYVWLGRRVSDLRPATRQRGRHDRVLGSRHRGFVEKHRGARETGGVDLEFPAEPNLPSQRLKSHEVGVQPTPADHVASGRWKQDAPEAREQRPRQQNGGPDALGEGTGGTDLGDPAGIHRDDVVPFPGHHGPQGAKNLRQRLDIIDARDVLQGYGCGCQKRRGEGGKSCVLVARRPYVPLQRMAAFDQEVCHGQGWMRKGRGKDGAAARREELVGRSIVRGSDRIAGRRIPLRRLTGHPHRGPHGVLAAPARHPLVSLGDCSTSYCHKTRCGAPQELPGMPCCLPVKPVPIPAH